MRKTLTLLFILIISKSVFSQTPTWLWAISQSGGSCYTQAQDLKVSPKTDSIYISGRYAGTITLGGNTSNAGGSKIFSAQLDGDGNCNWISSHAATGGYNYGFGIDSNDNTYTTGPYYVDKFDKTGAQKWVLLNLNASGYDVKADGAGNVYFTGEFSGTLTIGAKSITSFGSYDMFLAKLDSNGNCIWIVNGGGSGYDGGRKIGFDGDGYVYLTGSYTNNGIFGTQTAPAVTNGYPNLFITKYDTAGNALRVTTATNAGFDTNYQFWRWQMISVDLCGNIYVSGTFVNTAQFGSLSVTSAGSHDIFVAKCHFDGNWEWVKRAGGTGDDQGLGITVDRAGDIYAVGNFVSPAQFGTYNVTAGTAYIAKFTNSTGDVQWVQTDGGGGNWQLEGIGVDKKGFVYTVGTGSGTGTFGTISVTPPALCGQSIFVAKIDTLPTRTILPELSTSYCLGATVTLPYTTVGTFNAGNTFTAQLSDPTGNFISSTNIGSLSSTAGGNISITIPANTVPGASYLIRIVSSDPPTSSYAACTGNFIHNVYNNSFFISIGGNLSMSVSNDSSVCAGSQVQLNASGGASYTWSPSTDLSCTNCPNPVATPNSSVTYFVSASNGSCSASDSVILSVSPSVVLNVAPDTTVCSGSSVMLNPLGSSSYSYTWSPSADLNCSTCSNPLATPSATTTFTVNVGTGTCGGTAQVVVQIGGGNFDAGTITAIRDTICSGTPGVLNVAGSIGDIQWQSDTTMGSIKDISGATSASYVFLPEKTTYIRVVAGTGGCADTSIVFKLVVAPSPVADFTFVKNGLSCTFDGTVSKGASVYNWDFGDGQTSNISQPSHTYSVTDTFHACLTVFNGSNCSFTICRDLIINGVGGIKQLNVLKIYPDPFKDYLIIELKNQQERMELVEIRDILGRIVFSKNANNAEMNTMKLSVQDFAEGMYFLKLKTNRSEYVQKVIKQ